MTPWSAIIQALLGPVLKYLPFMAAWMKGGTDRQNKIELKAAGKTSDAIQDANKAASDAVDRAAAGKLRDSDFRD
jgi:hypothetical protein